MARPDSPIRLAAGIAACLVLSLAACSKGPEATRFLNFDAESSTGALVAGWSGFEKLPTGDTFVWANARQATIRIFAAEKGDRLLRFRCWPFGWPGSPGQVVTVTLNETRIDSVPLKAEPRVYSVAIPAAAWKVGPNELRLDFTYAEAPRDRIPGLTDERTLAVAFDWLEIVPPVPPEPKK